MAAEAVTPSSEIAANDEADGFELSLFSAREAYVYRVPPAGTVSFRFKGDIETAMRVHASSYAAPHEVNISQTIATQLGHRAELWDVNIWLAEVHVKVVRTSSDDAYIRLSDPASGDLFAECPVARPLSACVEPVIDSSRYFVLRVVDRDTGNHAFIGLGFRERPDASDFNAALAEHSHYLERKAAAAEMRKAYTEGKNGNGFTYDPDINDSDGAETMKDYSLRPGEQLTLRPTIATGRHLSGSGFVSSRGAKLTKTFSLLFQDGVAVAALASRPEAEPMGVSPKHALADGTDRSGSGWSDFKSAQNPPL